MRESHGGRDLTDIEEFWYSVENYVKDLFPINGVPEAIASPLKDLIKRARQLVQDGRAFLTLPALLEEENRLVEEDE